MKKIALCVECSTEIRKGSKYCKSCLRKRRNQQRQDERIRKRKIGRQEDVKSHQIVYLPKGSRFRLGSRFWRDEIEKTAVLGSWDEGTQFVGKRNGKNEKITIKKRTSYARTNGGLTSQELDVEEE